MENHKKTNQSGHGVHVCHKCGWSFPNPHPSAKQRRAHKKICGTIEGYKIGAAATTSSATTDPEEDVSNMDYAVSVAEHDSDSDRRTPCSKIVDKTVNSSPSIISSRSEDDLFSDAITDFARSPGVEEEASDRVCVVEPAKLVRKIDYGQPEEHQLNVENTTSPDAGNLCPTNKLVHGKQQQADQVSENEKEPAEGRMLSEKQMPSSTTLPPLHKEEAVVGENVKQSSDAVLLDTDAKESEVTLKDSPTRDEMSFNRTGRGLRALSAAKEFNGEPTDLQSVNPVMEVTEKQSISLEPHHESTSQVSKDEKIDVCVYPEQVMGHSEGKVGIPTDMDERHDTKISVNENLHSSVVSDDLPLEEHPTFAGKGYKDHKSETYGIPVPDIAPAGDCVGHEEEHDPEEVRAVEFVRFKEDHVPQEVGSVDSGGHKEDYVPGEVRAVECVGHKEDHVSKEVRSVDSVENKEDFVMEGSHSTISPTEPCQNVISINSPSKDDTSSNSHLVEEKLEQKSEQIKLTVAEVSMDDPQAQGLETMAPVVCESSVMEVGSGLNGSGTKPKQTVGFLEEQNSVVPCILAEDCSKNGKSFDVRVDDNNKQEIHSIKDDVADFDDEAKEHGIVIHENHDSKSTENTTPLAKTALSESAGATPSQVSQTTNSPGGCDAGNHDEVGPQIVNSNAHAERSGLNEENQSIDSKRSSECEFHTLELHGGMETKKELQVNDEGEHADIVSDLGESGQLSNRTESQSLMNNLSVLQDDAEEHKVSDNKMVELECNYEFDTRAAAAQVGGAELTRKETVYMDAVSSFKSSDAVDDNTKELDTGTSIVADSVLVGNDKNLIEQNCASVTDALADTASQTDSLEGHWGSISVLSDAPNVNDTEPLPTIDSQAAEASGLKPKATASDQQIDKSNSVEPPTSTMSGEPNITVEPQGGSCEIQTLENSAALQSGGLQSVTHVSTDSPRKGPNEEIIAKVNSWSTGSGKQHTPLKNLLGEAYDNSRANSPNIKKDVSVTNNGAPVEDAAKARAEAEKEWNSPARYPANIERKKGKVKSKPYWVPLFCCSSSIHSN